MVGVREVSPVNVDKLQHWFMTWNVDDFERWIFGSMLVDELSDKGEVI